MASTYSNLKFELIGTGELSGTWGSATNTNIGTAIEQAIVGMATLDSGDFTANVATLSLTNTSALQDARALCLNIDAGAVSAAGTVNVPAIEKPYIIINGSSYTVTVKVSGQTGVAVPAGKRTVVYNNGTDVGSQIDWLAALDITTVNATTVNATTVDTTNLEVTNIKAKDGTAGMQIADSTGVVSFTANPVMSGGTANGVAYLNGSKVLTTGSALTFDGTTLANTGNITAGTTSSGANLNAYASTYNSNGMVRLFGTDGNNKVEFGASSATTAFLIARAGVSMIFGANDSEQMRLTSTGLGIGTSSPAVKLHAYSGTSMGQITADGTGAIKTGVNFASGGTTYGQIYFDNNSPYDMSVMQQYSTGSLRFGTNNTERARIDSSGYLRLNNTDGGNYLFKIKYDGSGQEGIGLQSSYSGFGNMIRFLNSAGTTVGIISTDNTNTTYTTSSDYRLKENIQPMTGALAKVAALKPVTYTWKVDGSAGEGFIAHELAEVCPAAVTGEKDAVDADGKPQYQGIDVSFLVGTLTAAIQELKAEFDAYKAAHP